MRHNRRQATGNGLAPGGRSVPVVGVTGASGSGKSSIATALCEALCSDAGGRSSAVMLSIDWYYHDLSRLPPEARRRADFDRVDAIDWTLFSDNLNALKRGLPCLSPRYDFATSRRCSAFVPTPPGQLIIVEGIFVLAADALRGQVDYTVLVSTDDRIRRHRRVARDISQRGFTEADAIRQERQAARAFGRLNPNPDKLADLVVDGSAPLEDTIDTLLAVLGRVFSKSFA